RPGLSSRLFTSLHLYPPLFAPLSPHQTHQVISARGCSFSGFLPPALGYAPRLQSLDLGGNQLAGGIPPTWGQMGSLTSLVMNGNQLSESIPSALNGLSALQHEARLLSAVRHDNILPVVGCWEGAGGSGEPMRVLLYDYMPNGDLREFLYDELASRKSLQWPVRFRVAMGVARGLAFLHSGAGGAGGMGGGPMAHGAVHPGNVLLDGRMEPKLADMGVARIAFDTDDVQVADEIMGYTPPGMWRMGSCGWDHADGIMGPPSPLQYSALQLIAPFESCCQGSSHATSP
ncbi:unnamed protein product, partial [Closterium sp. NIES-54]